MKETVKWDEIKRSLEGLLGDMNRPSLAEVALRNGWHLGSLMENFPELCAQISERHVTQRKNEWCEVGRELKSITGEVPPPSMRKVVMRLGRSETSLYSHFPDLCHRISERHAEYRRKRFASRRERFLLKVRRAALSLHAEGTEPTVKNVEARLGRPKSLRSDKAALGVLREVRGDLNLPLRKVIG